MEEKKKSVWKSIGQIVVGIIGLIIIAVLGASFENSDNNQSTKDTTVATSTNPVETENKEKSQQTATKDNTTTATTNSKNISSNSLVEVSDVSYTGMRFKKSWSEFKNQIQQNTSNISVKWETVKPYSNKSLTEYGMLYIKYNERTKQQYVALQINFVVEDNTDKLIGMYCLGDKNTITDDYKIWLIVETILDENIFKTGQELIGGISQAIKENDNKPLNVWDPEIFTYFENNIFWFVSIPENYCFYVFACNDEEAQYYRENGKWRETKGQATNDNEKTFTTAEEIAQGTTSYSANTNQNNNSTRQYLDNTTLQAKGLAKCLDQNMNIKSLLNSGDFVHKEEVTKNSDGSVTVHIGLYEKETYEYSRMYGIQIYEVAYDDVTLTKEEATR